MGIRLGSSRLVMGIRPSSFRLVMGIRLGSSPVNTVVALLSPLRTKAGSDEGPDPYGFEFCVERPDPYGFEFCVERPDPHIFGCSDRNLKHW